MSRIVIVFLLALGLHSAARAEPTEAFFAGGCFWCMESVYQELDGVIGVVSGFTGGTLKKPTYSGDHSGHYEAIKVSYDPDIISYSKLLEIFWINIDPLDDKGQFCDKGSSYRSAIFVSDNENRSLTEKSLQKVNEQFSPEQVQTEILPVSDFWPVEEYHQDYYLKNPVRYKFYRWNCGRSQRLTQIWGDQGQH